MKVLVSVLLVISPLYLNAQFNMCDNPSYSLVADLDTTYTPKEVEQSIVEIDGVIYYSFDDGVHGNELWRSDGSSKGTYMIMDIFPGEISSNPNHLTELNGQLMFSALSPTLGIELWYFAYGQLGAIPQVVADISSGKSSSQPAGFHVMEGSRSDVLYFSASRQSTGTELWISEGTKLTTRMVKDINPGPESSNPSNFCSFEAQIFFSAEDGDNGIELFKSNGSDPGTVLVKDILEGSGGSDPKYLIVYDGNLYFSAESKIEGTNKSHTELWKSDGTDLGTILLKDLNETTTGFGTSGHPNSFELYDNELYFIARNSSSIHRLWKTDGTTENTIIVGQLNYGYSGPLLAEGGLLYYGSDGGRDLSVYNSATNSLVTLAEEVYPDQMTGHNGNVFFHGRSGFQNMGELYVSGGMPVSTGLLFDIEPNGESHPQHFISSDELYFFAHTRALGYELYQFKDSDGSLNMVKDASSNNYTASSRIRDVVGIRDDVYIIPPITSSDKFIYRLENDNLTLIEFEAGAIVDDDLFLGHVETATFAHEEGDPEIYIYSEISDEFELHFDFNGVDGVIVTSFSIPNYFVVFYYNYIMDQYEIWSCDSSLVFEQISTIDYLTNYNGEVISVFSGGNLFFMESTKDGLYRLWKTDGTVEGTEQLDFFPVWDARPSFTIERLGDGIVAFDGYREVFYYTEGTEASTDSLTSQEWPIEIDNIYEGDVHVSKDEVYVLNVPDGLYKINEDFSGLDLIHPDIPYLTNFWANSDTELSFSNSDSLYLWTDESWFSFFKPEKFRTRRFYSMWGQIGVLNYNSVADDDYYIPEFNTFSPAGSGFEKDDRLSDLMSRDISGGRIFKVIGDRIFFEADDGITGTEIWEVNCRCSESLNVKNRDIELGEYHSAGEIDIEGATNPNGLTLFNTHSYITINNEFEVRKSSQLELRLDTGCK